MKGLYLVTDRGLCGHRPLADVVLQAIRGGASCVQLREKGASTRAFVEEARGSRSSWRPFGCRSSSTTASTSPLPSGRRRPCRAGRYAFRNRSQTYGTGAIIGFQWKPGKMWSGRKSSTPITSGEPRLRDADQNGHQRTLGHRGDRQDQGLFPPPLVAIGGMNASNAETVVMAGADGVAVVSAICAAPDPLAASRELTDIIAAALQKRSGTRRGDNNTPAVMTIS